MGIKNLVSVFFLEISDAETLRNEIGRVIGLIEKEKPQELRLFRNCICNYFQGDTRDLTEKLKESISELERIKDMLRTSLKKRDKQNFELGITL